MLADILQFCGIIGVLPTVVRDTLESEQPVWSRGLPRQRKDIRKISFVGISRYAALEIPVYFIIVDGQLRTVLHKPKDA